MNMRSGEMAKETLSFIGSEGVVLSLGDTVANLRTCATFATVPSADMHRAANTMIHTFFDKEA